MTSVWKRLQRVNKRAAKFEFTASYHRVNLETTSKWKPNKLSIVWSRRSRRVTSEPLEWEPSMKEPLKGSIMWAVPDNHTIAVTLFRDQRTNELEDKDWIFILEDVSTTGRRRRVAQVPLNLKPLASVIPSQETLNLQMRPCTTKVTSASIEVTVSSVLLREGSAADEDMQSMASMMSANNNSDIGHLDDFEDEDISFTENSTSYKQSAGFGYKLPSDKKMLDLTQQMELMTSSLAGTPGSAASLSVTPVASTPQDINLDQPNRDSFKLPSLPYDDNKYINLIDNAQYSTRQASKENLKPLELKRNLNDYPYSKDIEEDNSNVTTPIVENSKICLDKTLVSADDKNKVDRDKFTRELSVEDNSGKDVTPAHDLLEWCKEITKDYPKCNITNMTTSWSNGIAFCAIIHHFRPDLIDMSKVSLNDAEGNIRMALKASETLGVPIVLHPKEIRRTHGPDKLALLTYLHQLRALFTNRQFRLSKIGQTAEESSYTVGRFNTDKNTNISVELFSQEIISMRPKKNDGQIANNRASLSSQDSMDSQHSQEKQSLQNINSPDKISNTENQTKDKSPMNNMISTFSKFISPTKEKFQNFKSSFDNSKFSSKEVTDTSSNNKSYVINKDFLLKKDNKKDVSLKVEPIKQDSNSKDSSLTQSLDVTVRETRPVKLMTRKQLNDPFGSDEEDENQDVLSVSVKEEEKSKQCSEIVNESDQNSIDGLSPVDSLPKPTQQLLSRHDELKEKARQLLEATRKEAREESVKTASNTSTNLNGVKVQKGPASPQKSSEDARQAQLRERARKLIADARAGLINSPTSPSGRIGTIEVLSASQILAEQQLKSGGISPSNQALDDNILLEKVDESLKSSIDAENNAIDERVMEDSSRSPLQRSFDGGVKKSSSPLRSFTNIMERISPDKDSFIMKGFGKDMRNYIQSEMEALEREQSAIDKQATILEKEVRSVMESGQSEEEENALLAKWFTLVNKKNALLKRQMQLNILEQENELRARHAKVDEELRALMTVEEWRKSEGQRGDEARLLRELLNVVDARDQIVHLLHEHEQALEDDDEIERNLSNVELKKKNNCFIQ